MLARLGSPNAATTASHTCMRACHLTWARLPRRARPRAKGLKEAEIKGMASAMQAFLNTPPKKASRPKPTHPKAHQPPVGLAHAARAAQQRATIPPDRPPHRPLDNSGTSSEDSGVLDHAADQRRDAADGSEGGSPLWVASPKKTPRQGGAKAADGSPAKRTRTTPPASPCQLAHLQATQHPSPGLCGVFLRSSQHSALHCLCLP